VIESELERIGSDFVMEMKQVTMVWCRCFPIQCLSCTQHDRGISWNRIWDWRFLIMQFPKP